MQELCFQVRHENDFVLMNRIERESLSDNWNKTSEQKLSPIKFLQISMIFRWGQFGNFIVRDIAKLGRFALGAKDTKYEVNRK